MGADTPAMRSFAEKTMKTILLCLSTKKGHEVLKEAILNGSHASFIVSVSSEVNMREPYDKAIRELATDAGLRVVPWQTLRKDLTSFLKEANISAIMCIGWGYLIPRAALEYLAGEVIVAHDSLLPKFRGFAPLPTALIVGEEQTGVTFLRAGSEIDDGDVLWQGSIPIEPTDLIAQLIDKVCPLYREGAREYFQSRLVRSTPQNHALATYSIWRDEHDYRIDWSLDAERIERTIRALGTPYLGAQALLGGNLIIIEQSEVLSDLCFSIRQPGKVWSLDSDGRPTIVCGRGLLKVTHATNLDGSSALPLKSLRQRFA
jgi:methionyl-tRNA formyltransferase